MRSYEMLHRRYIYLRCSHHDAQQHQHEEAVQHDCDEAMCAGWNMVVDAHSYERRGRCLEYKEALQIHVIATVHVLLTTVATWGWQDGIHSLHLRTCQSL